MLSSPSLIPNVSSAKSLSSMLLPRVVRDGSASANRHRLWLGLPAPVPLTAAAAEAEPAETTES